ncbi:unnamed protein product [Eruca vesicaria subsp. sativa]|uniref:Alpha/beta hydrolase fold-3 domain-containing protein n=1 Tax=Eruca vesicaria subsp. sativa TaxID=29727 RepID=A0ABC8KT63_ERUVS|nr:unnamed protein product [Eruca vesicaria subsp. sativa]
MSESFQASEIDFLASIGIVMNQDGTITRDPTRFPCVPATPNITKDIVVNHSKSTWMRLYVPITALKSKKLPLVVFYHGVGFITNSIDPVDHEFCHLMALKLNVVVALASYRVAPEFKLPAAYDDGVDAVKWLRNSEDEWIKSYVDLSDVFLMGKNSGGNVAYNVGIRSNKQDLTPLCIRGLILLDPFFGGQERCESELRHVNDQVFPAGLGGKVTVTGEGGGAMIDRQRDVANLMKENGVAVIEHFIDGSDPNKTETMFASIKSLIYSSR